MKLSARTRYAVRILVKLGRHGTDSPLKTTSLSESSGVSVQFIEQILRPLKKAGLITSMRGAAGGHMLAKSPDAVSVGDVIRIMEGHVGLTACCDIKLADECPRKDFCTTRSVWIKASQVLENELNSISLQDIIDGKVHPIE